MKIDERQNQQATIRAKEQVIGWKLFSHYTVMHNEVGECLGVYDQKECSVGNCELCLHCSRHPKNN